MSLAWEGNQYQALPSDQARRDYMDLIYRPVANFNKGLGLTIARYNIGGGKNPNETIRMFRDIEGFVPKAPFIG